MQLKKRLESLEAIILMGEKLLTTFDVEELLQELATNVCRLLEADGATLYLVDPFEGCLISQSIKSEKVKEISLPIDHTSIAGHTAITRKYQHIPDAYADLSSIHPDLKFNSRFDAISGQKTKNIIAYPLIIHQELIGVFQVINKKSTDFSEDDQSILRNFCLIAGIAIMNARLMERVLEAQASNANIIDNISDLVVIQNEKGLIMHLNSCATSYLETRKRGGNFIGRNFADVFPEFGNLAGEIAKVVEHRLDKSVAKGNPAYVILSEKNFKQEIERIILILQNFEESINLEKKSQSKE